MANIIVSTIRELLSDGHDPLAIIAAVLNESGQDVVIPKANSGKRGKKVSKKNKDELIQRADEEHPEWGMNGDYKYISAKSLSNALESGVKPIRKPLSGYMMFLQEKRPELKLKLTGDKILKEAGAMWRKLSDDEKNTYTNMGIQAITDKYGAQTNSYKVDEKNIDSGNDSDVSENDGGGGSKPDESVKIKKMNKNITKKPMKKAELTEHLSSKYGWNIKEIAKFTVKELRIADETGEFPQKNIKKPKAKKDVKITKKSEDTKAKHVPKPNKKGTPIELKGMFDSDCSDSESEE